MTTSPEHLCRVSLPTKPPIDIFAERTNPTSTLLNSLKIEISVTGVFTFITIITLLVSTHSLYLYLYRRRYEAAPTLDPEPINTKSEKDEENQAPPPVAKCNGRVPSLVGKLLIGLATTAYIALTAHVVLATAGEHKGFGPLSLDTHLRNSLAGCAFTMYFRLPFRNKNGLSKKYQADALLLIIIPYIIDFYAPPTNFKERVIIDRIILPVLGALCLVGSTF